MVVRLAQSFSQVGGAQGKWWLFTCTEQQASSIGLRTGRRELKCGNKVRTKKVPLSATRATAGIKLHRFAARPLGDRSYTVQALADATKHAVASASGSQRPGSALWQGMAVGACSAMCRRYMLELSASMLRRQEAPHFGYLCAESKFRKSKSPAMQATHYIYI